MTRRTWGPPKLLVPDEQAYVSAQLAAERLDITPYTLTQWAMHGYIQQYYIGLMPEIKYFYEIKEIEKLEQFLAEEYKTHQGKWSTWSKSIALRDRYVN